MIDGHCVRNLARSLVRLCLIEVPLVLMISASSRAQAFAVLHTFTGDDGSSPYAGVTVDRAGNLYGTTKYGGTASCDLGCGALFKVATQGSGWNFAPLYKFAGPSDGKSPIARIVFGPDGRLYGTTLIGGNTTVNGGTVFTLTPPSTVCRASCYWVKTTLWSFGQNDGDAHNPGYGDLVFDAAGNIYGTTEEGGTTQPACGPGCGTVFMLSRSQGSWSETLIYQFGDDPGITLMPESLSMATAICMAPLLMEAPASRAWPTNLRLRMAHGRRQFSTTSPWRMMVACPALV